MYNSNGPDCLYSPVSRTCKGELQDNNKQFCVSPSLLPTLLAKSLGGTIKRWVTGTRDTFFGIPERFFQIYRWLQNKYPCLLAIFLIRPKLRTAGQETFRCLNEPFQLIFAWFWGRYQYFSADWTSAAICMTITDCTHWSVWIWSKRSSPVGKLK